MKRPLWLEYPTTTVLVGGVLVGTAVGSAAVVIAILVGRYLA